MKLGVTDKDTQGNEVSQLQYYLKQGGYYSGKITGNYLSITKHAVEEFQKDNNVAVTGIVNKTTRNVMRELGCR